MPHFINDGVQGHFLAWFVFVEGPLDLGSESFLQFGNFGSDESAEKSEIRPKVIKLMTAFGNE